MTDRPLTLMAVHAHPDDEATSTGGVFAMYAAQGITTVLVTCTDGSCGDGPGGVKPGEPGHDPVAIVEMRNQELRASCDVLNVTHLEQLGYADSGMEGWPQNEAPNAFWNTPVSDAAAKLAALMEKYQPDVVITYDDYGFYGHPDHIQAHRITMAAVEMTDIPAKVYETTVPRSKFEEFARIVRELGGDWDEEVGEAEQTKIGALDEDITTWVDAKSFGAQKFKSLEAHASQGENIFFLKMGVDLFTEMMGTETFVRRRDTTNASLPETDLFAGLR